MCIRDSCGTGCSCRCVPSRDPRAPARRPPGRRWFGPIWSESVPWARLTASYGGEPPKNSGPHGIVLSAFMHDDEEKAETRRAMGDEVDQERATRPVVTLAEVQKWVRVQFGGVYVADSTRVKLLRSTGRPPVYLFPEGDVDLSLIHI